MNRFKTVLIAGFPYLVVLVFWQVIVFRHAPRAIVFTLSCPQVFTGHSPVAPNPSIEQLEHWLASAHQAPDDCRCAKESIELHRLQIWIQLSVVAETGVQNLRPLDQEQQRTMSLLFEAADIADHDGKPQGFISGMDPYSIAHEPTRNAYLRFLAARKEYQITSRSQLRWHALHEAITTRAGKLLSSAYPQEPKRKAMLAEWIAPIALPSTEFRDKLFAGIWDASLKK